MQYTLDDLLYLMSRLRDPEDGCPWDRVQNFSSIAPHTIEESYELADAIAKEDFGHIREELGDVLFQVIFYSQLGKEQGHFTFAEIVSGLVEKLLRRHPHVFPDGSLQSRTGKQTKETADVKKSWELIKADERQLKQQSGILDDIPIALPALTRAGKLQKRASQQGFDWNHIDGVIAKLHEELGEIEEARREGDSEAIQDEIGDLLFACVNLARHLKVDPEMALRGGNQKFERRFRYIEQSLGEQGMTVNEATLEQMDSLWDEAKGKGL